VKIGDQQLERVEKMKYLGVLDEGLKLNEHLDYICKKMGKIRKYEERKTDLCAEPTKNSRLLVETLEFF
jgi:hypothetical protein